MFQLILEKLKAILKANTLLSDVYAYEKIETDSDPFAVIVPSANDSSYQTTEENVRTYAFKIMVFVSRKLRSEQQADEVAMELIDSIMDDIDKDYDFSTIGIPQKTGYTFLQIFAVPSAWGYAAPEDEYRVATIECKALVSIDLNSIS